MSSTNEKPKRFTRQDLVQPPGTTLNQNSDGTAKSERQIKWEQSVADLANWVSDLPKKAPVKPPTEDDEDD